MAGNKGEHMANDMQQMALVWFETRKFNLKATGAPVFVLFYSLTVFAAAEFNREERRTKIKLTLFGEEHLLCI